MPQDGRPPATNPALLLLADGRFPAGAHAHSFGMEAAIAAGDVRTVDDLERYLAGRLATTGLVDAAFAVATGRQLSRDPAGTAGLLELDAELAARTPSPTVRAASRSLGRQLLRAGGVVWPSPVYALLRSAGPAAGPFAPLAFGATAWAAGLDDAATAAVSLHHLTSGLTSATVRLLGLDPFAVAARTARLASVLERVARSAVASADGPPSRLPAAAAPLVDVFAEHHATWEVRLFAS